MVQSGQPSARSIASLEVANSARNRHAVTLADAAAIAKEAGVRDPEQFAYGLRSARFREATGGVGLEIRTAHGNTFFVAEGTPLKETDYAPGNRS